MIYLDNAATTLQKPNCVALAVLDAMRTLGNSGRGLNQASHAAGSLVYEARCVLTDFFGGSDPSRLVFTANATEALNIVIKGLLKPGDHAITTELDHNSVLRPLYELERQGLQLSIAEADATGNVNAAGIEALIRPETRAIVMAHASNLSGNLTDLKAVSELAHKHGLLLIADASQTAGEIPINVSELGIDVLCFTGHKGMLGPQGTGGLYVRPGITIRPLLHGGTGVQSFLKTQPRELPEYLEAGTLNGHGIAGLKAAAEFLREIGPERIEAHHQTLTKLFYSLVSQSPEIRIYGDFRPERSQSCTEHPAPMDGQTEPLNGQAMERYQQPYRPKRRAPIVSLNIGDLDSSVVGDLLMQEYGIAVRTGAHCAPLMHRRFGTEKQGAVRLSFSWFNSEEEVRKAAAAVLEIAADTAQGKL